MKHGDSNIRIKDTKVIRIGVDETASQPILNGHMSLRQGTLNRRQHVCARISSDDMWYTMDSIHFDAASPEPEVVVMVDHNLESGCDDEQYSRMHSHVIPPPLLCDSHVTDPMNHLYNTVDPRISLNYTLYYGIILSHAGCSTLLVGSQALEGESPSNKGQ